MNKKYFLMSLSGLVLISIYIILILNYQEYPKQEIKQPFIVYVVVDFSNGTVLNKSYLLNTSESAFTITNNTYSIKYLYYESLGYFITEINNVSQNDTYFWLYYINNSLANVGSSSYYITQPYTTILWKISSKY